MDFPDRLPLSLDKASSINIENVTRWNVEIEEFLAASDPPNSEESKEESTKERIADTTTCICNSIIENILNDNSIEFISGSSISETINVARERYLESPPTEVPRGVFELVRAGKNLLRWYIQIYITEKGAIIPSAVAKLQGPELLNLLVFMLEQHTIGASARDLAFARNISLYIFYATYIAFPGDESASRALRQVIIDLNFTKLSLSILSRSCTAALALSVVRNLHNAIVTLQGASKIILDTTVDLDLNGSLDMAPWIPQEVESVTFRSICASILGWTITSNPTFPGDVEDKRAELAVEILGALYAVRAGNEIVALDKGNSLASTVVSILNLGSQKDKRVRQCQLSAISLLMDSNSNFGEQLVGNGSLKALLEIFNLQVQDIISKTRVDNSAAASLVPCLVVLTRYAGASRAVHKEVKSFVFPPEDEPEFQKKAQEQLDSAQSKNMAPLDAPEGSLRGNLVNLLTWPEGHIKRCTGELFWALCSSNPTEFVHRVGFGNALPLLSVKGFAKMPVPT